jgi:hypothetical protein
VGLFRKREESYNERMLREAGLLDWQREDTKTPEPEPADGEPPPFHVERGDPVLRGPDRQWDAATTATVPGLTGDRIEFTTLPDGDTIVSEEAGEGDVSPLADAIEEHVRPPYRAVAARQRGDLWGVGAKAIEVARIPFPTADSLELSRKDSWDELRVDGEPSDASIPELERLGERAGRDFYVKAERIDGDFWEARVSAP